MRTKLLKSCRILAVLALSLGLLPSCGIVPYGGGAPNDPVPSGNIVASGNLTSTATGKTVSGVVTIYNPEGFRYVMRLSGVSTPAEAGLQLIANVNGTELDPVTLRAYTGNQNYTIQLAAPSNWQQVRLHSTSANTDYAVASLVAPAH